MLNVRNSVKVILLNKESKLLLMGTDDPNITDINGQYRGRFWQLIGGGVEPGEHTLDTAKRELFEETGLKEKDVCFGPVVWHGTLNLVMYRKKTRILQRFIICRTEKLEVDLNHLTEAEKTTAKQLKWFSVNDIINCNEIIYPVVLSRYLEEIIHGRIPDPPIEIPLE